MQFFSSAVRGTFFSLIDSRRAGVYDVLIYYRKRGSPMKTCPSCGAACNDNEKFCGSCGYSFLEAGSVSSLPFVQKGVEDTLKEVPAEKVICALPLYTRLWKSSNGTLDSEIYSMPQTTAFMQEHSLTPQWLEEVGQNYVEVVIEGVTNQIWIEDGASLRVKLDAIKTSGLKGVAFWKLGRESTDVWNVISSYMRNNR